MMQKHVAGFIKNKCNLRIPDIRQYIIHQKKSTYLLTCWSSITPDLAIQKPWQIRLHKNLMKEAGEVVEEKLNFWETKVIQNKEKKT